MPGTTNFVQVNPTQSNQATDATYQALALVTGGIQLNNILPSTYLNKLFYQLSTFVAAFASMLVNKGFSPMDTSESALAAVLANVLTTADTQPALVGVAYSANPIFNRAAGQNFQMTVTGNVTGPTLVGNTAGQEMTFCLITDATAGHTFAWPTNFANAGDMVTVPMLANTTYIQKFFTRSDGFVFAVTPLMQNP